MVTNHVKMIAAGFVASVALATPTAGSAQSYRYADDEPAVVVECAPGQRAVMAQRRVNGSTQVVAVRGDRTSRASAPRLRFERAIR